MKLATIIPPKSDQRTSQHNAYKFDDDNDDEDYFSLQPTVNRSYDIDTILSFSADPFKRTSSYDEFDDMINSAS